MECAYKWKFSCGRIKFGETYEQVLVREIKGGTQFLNKDKETNDYNRKQV